MLKELVRGKRVLFITTKNIDYIRNSQEIRILKENAKSLDLIYSSKNSYPKRLLAIYSSLIVESVKSFLHTGIIYNNDVVFVGFAPQLILPFFYRAFRKKLIIIDFFISVYDTLICDRQKFKDGGMVSNVCHQVDEITLSKANHVITDTKAQADFFVEEFKATSEVMETIYLEADKNIYYNRPQVKAEELKDKFIVLYFGSILPLQGVDVVLDAIRQLKDNDKIFFDIIGPIPKELHKPIQSNVCYTDWITQDELAVRIARADLCLAGHFSGSIAKASRTIPGKAYIYEEMGRKIILGDTPANRELFVDDDRHFFVKIGDAKSIADEVLKQELLVI